MKKQNENKKGTKATDANGAPAENLQPEVPLADEDIAGNASVANGEATADAADVDAFVQADAAVALSMEEFTQVKAHIEALQKEKAEAVEIAKRVQAEFDNYRKRNSTLKKDSYDEGTRDCIRVLLPTLDNFDRALMNTDGVNEAFAEGVRLVQKTLLASLERLGLKEIPADGKFDANLHDAVMQEAAQGKGPEDILEVLQKGYEVNGKILRHSMVKVAQ